MKEMNGVCNFENITYGTQVEYVMYPMRKA